MKDWVVAVALAGVLLSGCATTQPEGIDTAANEPDLPTLSEEEAVESALRESDGKGAGIDPELTESDPGIPRSGSLDAEESGVLPSVNHEGDAVTESPVPRVPPAGGLSEKNEKIVSGDSDELSVEPVSQDSLSLDSLAEGYPPTPADLGEATSEPRSSTFPLVEETPASSAPPSSDSGSSIANDSPPDSPEKHLPASVSSIVAHSIESKAEQPSPPTPIALSDDEAVDSLQIPVRAQTPLSPANEAASRTTVSPVPGPVAEPDESTGRKVSPADRGFSSPEAVDGSSAANGPSTSSPAGEEQGRPSGVVFSSRPEAANPSEAGPARHRRIGSRDAPLIAFLGQKTSRSRVGFSEEFAPEGQPSDDEERTGIGFSRRPTLSSWLRSEPIRRVGFSGKPESVLRESEKTEEPGVSSGGGTWEYRAAASWLRRRDAEKRELSGTDARSYEEVETWLRRNVPEGSELPELTVREYARAEAWLRAKGEIHSEDDSINASSRKYAALAKWLHRNPSSPSFEASASDPSARREYSKVLQWLRGYRAP